VRNRIKRQIRESFRVSTAGLIGTDVVVVANVSAASAPNAVLRQSLIQLLQKTTKP
jgi:ribonuclease P protein component